MRIKGYWPALVWAFIILVLTITPSDKIPHPPEWRLSSDKVAHFVLFLGLAVLIHLGGIGKDRIWGMKKFWGILLILVCYGLLLELMQIVVPSRSFNWMDLAADGAGALAGNFIFLKYVNVKKILAKR